MNRAMISIALALAVLALPLMGGRALAEHQSLSPPSSSDENVTIPPSSPGDRVIVPPSTDEDSSGSASIPNTDGNGIASQRVMGQVMALNMETGQVLLKTRAGMLALQGAPEEVQKLNVGDVIVVELREATENPSPKFQ
jgi:hypothetical protein